MSIERVLREMRERAINALVDEPFPSSELMLWASVIEAAMREKDEELDFLRSVKESRGRELDAKDAEIQQLRAFLKAISERSDEQRHIEAQVEIEKLREAVTRLLACPAIADEYHGDPEWGCAETLEAEAFARSILNMEGEDVTDEKKAEPHYIYDSNLGTIEVVYRGITTVACGGGGGGKSERQWVMQEPVATIYLESNGGWSTEWHVNRYALPSSVKLYAFPPHAAKEIERLEERVASAADGLLKRDAEIAELREALEFYADPETYFGIAVIGDSPCGAFIGDLSDDHGHPYLDGPRYGKVARATLAGKEDKT